MTESNPTSVPRPSGLCSGGGGGFTAGRGLPGRVRSVSAATQPGRLTSLRTRDLTLGGAFKKTKKTFEPNVHSERKSKDELKEEIQVAPKKERKERDERRRENRVRRKERPKTIQSHSIFEQGPAVSELRAGWHGATGLCSSTSSPVCKPVEEDGKVLEKDEDHLLSKLQRDDFIDDPDVRNDARWTPIQLPLCQSGGFPRSQTRPAPTREESSHLSKTSCGAQLPKAEQLPLVKLLQDLSVSGREELFFIQLPDCMPGTPSGLRADPTPRATSEKLAKKEGKSEAKMAAHLQSQEAVVKKGCVMLSQFPEGFLGKLQIRKSGKMELKLGDVVMDVSEGAAFSFLQ
ncbi:DNA-directed RNA polymerase III subunit RPC4 isoform 2-T3 [Odontesthes bonariensis]